MMFSIDMSSVFDIFDMVYHLTTAFEPCSTPQKTWALTCRWHDQQVDPHRNTRKVLEKKTGSICSNPLITQENSSLENPCLSMNYGRKSSDHIREILNPYEEKLITERNGDRRRLLTFCFPMILLVTIFQYCHYNHHTTNVSSSSSSS